MADRKDDVVTFTRRLTGYDHQDTRFDVMKKHQGTAPDITVYQCGQYEGRLTLDQRTARELARTLLYMIGDKE